MLTTSCLVLALVSGVMTTIGDPSCERLGVNFYEDIGCHAIKRKDAKCPDKYECNFAGIEKYCIFKGVAYSHPDGFAIDFAYDKCGVMCVCILPGRLFCTVRGCPLWQGVVLKRGCYQKYSVNTCCPVSQTCPSFHETPEVCWIDNDKYRLGEKFSPRHSCLTCICPKNFTGEYKEPYCQRKSCAVELRESSKVQQKCAPYFEASEDHPICCPDGWVCPNVTDEIITINPEAKNNPDLICEFGKLKIQLSDGLFSEVNLNGTIKDVKCECILPPLLTCKEKKNEEKVADADSSAVVPN